MSKTYATSFNRLFLETKISSISPHPADTVTPDLPVTEIAKLLAAGDLGCAAVIEGGFDLVGIVTERNLLAAVEMKPEMTARDIMSSPVTYFPYYASLARAIHAMCVGGFRHIPVTGTPGGLSILSILDVLSFVHKKLAPHIKAAEESGLAPDSPLKILLAPVSAMKPKKPLTLVDTSSVRDAISRMTSQHVGSSLVVSDAGRLKGIFTERDFVKKVLVPGVAFDSPIREVMSAPPYTLQEQSTVTLALSVFAEHSYRHLPIVDFDENLIGMISARDVISSLAEEILQTLSQAAKKD